jgi:hypothetical protein
MDPAVTLGLAALKQTGALDAMTGLAKDLSVLVSMVRFLLLLAQLKI